MSPEGARISDIIAPKVTVDPELRSGRTRTPMVQQQTPTVAPQPPLATDVTPFPMDVINMTESPVDITNRIESDPRYQSAEVNTLNAIKDWWNKVGLEPMTSPAVAPEAVSPRGFWGVQ
jgi:hypothetical protein